MQSNLGIQTVQTDQVTMMVMTRTVVVVEAGTSSTATIVWQPTPQVGRLQMVNEDPKN